MIRFLGSGLVAAGMMLVPATAAAADYRWLQGGADEVATAAVADDDLDLSRPEDVARLRQRVRQQARAMCRDGGPLRITLYEHRCVREATRAAEVQIANAARREARQLAERGR